MADESSLGGAFIEGPVQDGHAWSVFFEVVLQVLAMLAIG
jgi:hypothetical protein